MSKNKIFDNVIIGNNVRMGCFNVIGDIGFGYIKDKDTDRYLYPLSVQDHYYGVKLKDDVFIKNNVCIDRGRTRDTVIGRGTQIDNNVHIGHGAVIGEDNLIVAGTVIGGSCEIGDRNFLGINCSIKQGIKIGSDNVIGMGAVVIHNVPDNTTVVGNPARVKELIKVQAS
mgnify:CR=1 FL=1